VHEQQLTEHDLGNINFYDNNVLIAKSSSQILFYKIHSEYNPLLKKIEMKWKLYHELDISGFIFNIHDQNRVHIITDTLVYFYYFEQNDQ